MQKVSQAAAFLIVLILVDLLGDVDMPVTLGGIGSALGGAAAVGSLLSSSPDTSSNVRVEPSSRYQWKKAFKEGKRQFKIVTDSAIQRRVRDAKKAGLHPLFALGMAAPSAAGVPAAGQFASGSAAGDATRRMRHVAELGQVLINAETRARTRKTEAETAAIKGAEKRAEAEANAAPAGFVPGVDEVTNPIEPSRPFFQQLMKTRGAITIPEWDEHLAGAIAAFGRDAFRNAPMTRALVRELNRRFYKWQPRPHRTRKATRAHRRHTPQFRRGWNRLADF